MALRDGELKRGRESGEGGVRKGEEECEGGLFFFS